MRSILMDTKIKIKKNILMIHTKENILIMIHIKENISMIHIKENIELIHIKENILTMIHIKENIEDHVVQVGNWTALYVIHSVLVDSLELVQFVGEDSIHMVEELEQSHGHLANYRRKEKIN